MTSYVDVGAYQMRVMPSGLDPGRDPADHEQRAEEGIPHGAVFAVAPSPPPFPVRTTAIRRRP
jgi:hypothetical protein